MVFAGIIAELWDVDSGIEGWNLLIAYKATLSYLKI